MNWPKFVSMRKELNEKCKRIVDSEDCYLQFCVKRGSDECLIWKLTTDVLVVKINRTLKKSVSMRIVSLREWVSIYNSIMFTVDVSEPRDEESCSASTMNSNMWKSSVVSGTTNDDGTCLICFDRYPDTMLSCMHAFCHICVEKVKNSGTFLCPLCRTSLNENDNEDLWSIPDFPEASDIDNYLVSIAREKRSPVRQTGQGIFDSIFRLIENFDEQSAAAMNRLSDEEIATVPEILVNDLQVKNESQYTTCMENFKLDERVLIQKNSSQEG
uniref:RING-type domain-containing protein n=1 Tax=Rhabditophanes sp. KR3021 TaxID=114890 RepID=A0AC35UBT8_9BILA